MGVGKKTRKQQKQKEKKGMTIPELRRAFEHIEAFASTEKGQKLDSFRKEWRKVFGKDVSEGAAREYLTFMSVKPRKVQSGGMAPLEYTTRPGTDTPYGNFPPYVSSGFGIGNYDSFTLDKTDYTPAPAGLGSNLFSKGGGKARTTRRKKQKGGAMAPLPSLSTALQEAMTRPFSMSSPPSTLQTSQMAVKGVEAGADPRPEVPGFSFPTTNSTFTASLPTQTKVI